MASGIWEERSVDVEVRVGWAGNWEACGNDGGGGRCGGCGCTGCGDCWIGIAAKFSNKWLLTKEVPGEGDIWTVGGTGNVGLELGIATDPGWGPKPL